MSVLTTETLDAATKVSNYMKCVGLISAISARVPGMTPIQQAIACTVITNNLRADDLSKEKNLSGVLETIKTRCINQLIGWNQLSAVLEPLSVMITEGKTREMIELIDMKGVVPPIEVEEEPAPIPTPAQSDPDPTVENIAEPEPVIDPLTPMPAVDVPKVTLGRLPAPSPVIPVPPIANPNDPMSVMAESIGRYLGPLIVNTSKTHAIETMRAVKPIMDELASGVESLAATMEVINHRVNRVPKSGTSAASGKVDSKDVERIVDERLRNGTGEALRKEIGSISPALFANVLEKAADAVSAQAERDMCKVELTAAFTPEPDPHYAWTKEMSGIADLLHRASAITPQNALLVGPTGCGKSAYAFEFAASYKRKIMVMDCANLREAREWFGIKGVANGATYFKRSQFWLAVSAGNCVVLLDEFNRAPDHVRNPLMPLLDHRRQSFVEEVGETLKVGNGTVFFATMNEGLDYSGTHTTDRAMKNRFPRRIELGYLPDKMELAVILDKVDGLKKDDAQNLVELANTIRSKATGFGGGLSETLSTRQLIAVAQDFVLGGPSTFQTTVFSHFNAEGGTDSERAQVANMFQLKGFKLA